MHSSPPSLTPASTAGSSAEDLALRMTGSTPKKGKVAEPGFVGQAPGSGVIRIPPVSVCHQVSTMGHLSRPMNLSYHIQASGLIGSPTVPRSRSEERSLPCRPLVALSHNRPDSRRGGIENTDLKLLNDLPESVGLWISGHTFENNRRSAVGQRTIDDVGVTGYPADISRTPEDIFVLIIKDIFKTDIGINHIPADGMKNPFGFTG